MFAMEIEHLKTLKYNMFFKKILNPSIGYSKYGHEYKTIF